MVLPLLIILTPTEDAIRFIRLERYPQFFNDMESDFIIELDIPPLSLSEDNSKPQLVVHDAGDFDRLGERFQISIDMWVELPAYHDYGFAVFKLKDGEVPLKVHPVEFEFPQRHLGQLCFPTVHIRDGHVHSRAEFDRMLYCRSRNR